MASKIVVEVVMEIPLETWLENARGGSLDAMGWAFETCRPFLVQTAESLLAPELRVKEDVTDLVQETFLEAYRDFEQFAGQTGLEWKAWLRKILIHNLHHVARRYRTTEKRRIRREVPWSQVAPRGTDEVGLVGDSTSPSGRAMRKERTEEIRQAINRLAEKDREALVLRSREECTFEEMGGQMGCSAVAARKRWLTAINRLWNELGVSSMAR